MADSSPQRLRELFDEATHGEFSQIPDVLEAIQNEANEIIVNLEEQLEALQRAGRYVITQWERRDGGTDQEEFIEMAMQDLDKLLAPDSSPATTPKIEPPPARRAAQAEVPGGRGGSTPASEPKP